MGMVNCYLLQGSSGFVLIDSGCSPHKKDLDQALRDAGCRPGSLRLVVLTHGDFDHSGGCVLLRRQYGSSIAIHRGDAGIVEWGNMFSGRKKRNAIVKVLAPVMSGFGRSDRFTPVVLLEDGDSLSEYGLDATIVHLPGHSSGSLGVLTARGDFFCGDLLTNLKKPVLNSIMDDISTAKASIARMRSLRPTLVYPGHGLPFPFEMSAPY
jgi:hydroxyacylglutathione hydrolase